MLKIFGAFLGFIFFGPVGAILGFLIGILVDSRVRVSRSGFFFTDFGVGNIFKDSFPLFAAAVTRAGGVSKITVLTVKNIITQLFGVQNAIFMMQKYKSYVENGFDDYILNETCEKILYSLNHQSKIYIISLLFTILKSIDTFSSEEIFVIQDISRNIGISGYEFESLLNHYKSGDFRNNNYSQSRVYKSDPYKVLQIDKNTNIEDIKKQFRKLSKKYHPDVTLNLPENEKKEAEVKMKEIINAYGIIKKERGFN
jgi:DnaJ like chaperone protein